MKKIIYAAMFFLAITMMCGNAEKAEAKSYKAGKFKYQYKNTKKGVWITKITLLSSKGISKLDIPAKIKGKKVVKLGDTKDNYHTSDEARDLFGIMMCDPQGIGDFTISNPKLHKKIAKIKKIKLPSSIMSITPSCFYYVQDGKEINIPKGVKKEVVNQFTRVKWKKVKISSKNKTYKVKNGCLLSKNGKVMYGLVYKKKRVVVPKTVTAIETDGTRDTAHSETVHGLAFLGCETLVLPKSVKNVCIFSYSMMKVEVDSGSQYFASKDGSLYDKKDGRLVWLYQTDGIFDIPDGIREIPEPIRTYGWAKKIIIPASVKKVANIVQYCYVKDPVIVCKGKEPPTLSKEQTNSAVSLRDEVINITVYVPKGCKDAYEKTWQIDRSRVGSERIKFTFVEQ